MPVARACFPLCRSPNQIAEAREDTLRPLASSGAVTRVFICADRLTCLSLTALVLQLLLKLIIFM